MIASLRRGWVRAVLVAFLAGVGGPALRAEEAASPSILIGLLLPPEEAEAASLRRGAELGVEHANLTPGDPASLLIRGRVGQWGADGEEAGRMVLDDGVRGLIAPPGGAPSHLALQVSGRTAMPTISLCPDSSVTRAGIPWMARLAPGTIDEARLIFDAFKNAKPGQVYRWCALVPSERAGREAANDLRKAAEAAGCSLREPVKIVPEVSDLSEARRAVLTGNPDGILIWLDPEPAGRLAKELRADGFGGRLAGPSRLRGAPFVAAAGEAARGFVLPAPVLDAPSLEVWARFAPAYRARFGLEPDATAALAYDAARLLVDLVRKSGEKPAYRSFPIAGQQPGASGNLRFSPSGDRRVPLELREYRDGTFAPLAPAEGPRP